jgi:hypothetical protein
MSASTDRSQAGTPSASARAAAVAAGLLIAAAGVAAPACMLDAGPYESGAQGGPSGGGPTTSAGSGGGATVGPGGAGGEGGATGGTSAMGGASTTSTTGETTSTTTATSTTTTTSTGMPCQSGCDDCAKGTLDDECGLEAFDCSLIDACKDYAGCVDACGDDWCAPDFQTCQQSCLANHPSPQTNDLTCCVRAACAVECAFTPCP